MSIYVSIDRINTFSDIFPKYVFYDQEGRVKGIQESESLEYDTSTIPLYYVVGE